MESTGQKGKTMYRTILCSLKLTHFEVSVRQLIHTFTIAKLTGASVHLLHISEKVLDDKQEQMLRISLERFHALEEEAIRDIQSGIRELLEHPDVKSAAQGIKTEVRITGEDTHTGKKIVAVADELNADLIVITTCKHPSAIDLLIRSATDHVVSHAHCPVLVINRRD